MTTTREVRPEQHGTQTGYTYGCRCDDCRNAAATYGRIWRAENPDYPHVASAEACESVMRALLIEADMDGLVIATQDRLGEHVGLGHKTVGVALAQLAGAGRIAMDHANVRGNLCRIQLSEADL